MKKLVLSLMMLAPMTMLAQSMKFGHVNTQEIITAMPEYTQAKTKIDALQKQYENDLKIMQDELTKKSQDYEAARDSLPETIRQRRENELQEMYQKIQQAYQDNQQDLATQSQTEMQAITSKIVEAIKQVGEEGSYIYIMDLTGGIPYISTTLSTDLTSQVKAKLGL